PCGGGGCAVTGCIPPRLRQAKVGATDPQAPRLESAILSIEPTTLRHSWAQQRHTFAHRLQSSPSWSLHSFAKRRHAEAQQRQVETRLGEFSRKSPRQRMHALKHSRQVRRQSANSA